MEIYFDQFKREIDNSCKWWRKNTFVLISECGKEQYYEKKELDINYCPKCGRIIEYVK